MRLSEGRILGKFSMLACNYMACMILSGIYVGSGELFAIRTGATDTALMGCINGVFYMMTLVLTQYSIQKNGVILSSVFAKMGSLLVPLVVAIGVFCETPSIIQVIGAFLSILAILLLNYNGKREMANSHLLLFMLLLMEGMASSMSKIFDELGESRLAGHFLFYTFTVAFLLSGLGALLKREKLGLKEVLFGIWLGVPNFFASRFVLKALQTIPAVIVYPTRGVAVLLLVLLAGVILFKEKLKKNQWIGIVVVLIAVAMLNL